MNMVKALLKVDELRWARPASPLWRGIAVARDGSGSYVILPHPTPEHAIRYYPTESDLRTEWELVSVDAVLAERE